MIRSGFSAVALALALASASQAQAQGGGQIVVCRDGQVTSTPYGAHACDRDGGIDRAATVRARHNRVRGKNGVYSNGSIYHGSTSGANRGIYNGSTSGANRGIYNGGNRQVYSPGTNRGVYDRSVNGTRNGQYDRDGDDNRGKHRGKAKGHKDRDGDRD